MTGEPRSARLERLFAEAVDLGPRERERFVAALSEGDPELAAELQALLVADAHPTGGLPGSGPSLPVGAGEGATVPESIAGFRVIRALGAGGMGQVYLVEQDRPRRLVALKVAAPGLSDERLVRRLEAEGEVLGRLRHPGIAQVHAVGRTPPEEGSRPYFLMEHVDGVPITAACRQEGFGVRRRVELLARACEAVEHAHRHGVVHRDLKPDNILVTADGQPKVLDFGIARATDREAEVTRTATRVGEILGTVAYMSPEQALGEPAEVDARSDVHALGLVAFEVLTGEPARRLGGLALPEALRRVREEDVPAVRSARADLPDDLATIVAAATRREAGRRYQTVAELRQDLERWLRDEPIVARPTSVAYQVRKFVARHRGAVAAAALVVASLAAGLTGTAVGWRRAERARAAEQAQREAAESARDEAVRQREIAEAVTDFLDADLVAAAAPDFPGGPVETLPEAIDHAASRVAERFAGQPETEAAVRIAIGRSYHQLGRAEDCLVQAGRARELATSALGPVAPLAVTAEVLTAGCQQALGRFDEAVAATGSLVARLAAREGSPDGQTLLAVAAHGVALQEAGRLDEAETQLVRAVDLSRRLHGEDHERHAQRLDNLGLLLQRQGRFAEALPLLRRAVDVKRRTLGPRHPLTLDGRVNLAIALRKLGRFDEAEGELAGTLAVARELMGDGHPFTLSVLNNLSNVLDDLDRLDEAAAALEEALDGRRRTLGEDHYLTLGSLHNLGLLEARRGRLERGIALLAESAEGQRRVLGDGHPRAWQAVAALAWLQSEAGRHDDAARGFAWALERQVEGLGASHPDAILTRLDLAAERAELGQVEQAAASARRALELAEASVPEGHLLLSQAHSVLAVVLEHAGDLDAAARHLERSHALAAEKLASEDERLRETALALAALNEKRGDEEAAHRWRLAAGRPD